MKLQSVVINADDFGYSEGISTAIDELLRRHCITSTSIMIAAHGAQDRIDKYMRSGVLTGRAGIHLQLTGGSPLSTIRECPSLFDKHLQFRDPRPSGARPPVREVEIEWRRQIETVLQLLRGTPTHLDSHHGVHRLAEYFPLYLQLAQELDIPVRGPGPDLMPVLKQSGHPASTVMVRSWTGSNAGSDALLSAIGEALGQVASGEGVEIITHPGIVDAELLERSTMTYSREIEYRALLSVGPADLAAVGAELAASRAGWC